MTDNDETSAEDLPGCIGYTIDGEFYPGSELLDLEEFPWSAYVALVEEDGNPRKIYPIIEKMSFACEVFGNSDISELLDQLPSIEIERMPPVNSPAAGSGYLIFLTEGTESDQLDREVSSLLQTLNTDLEHLSKKHPSIAKDWLG